jgi:hypothetical protein
VTLWFGPALAADVTPCITWDNKPLPIREYFRDRNGFDPYFNHGQWSHRYQDEWDHGLQIMMETIADYNECIANYVVSKKNDKK